MGFMRLKQAVASRKLAAQNLAQRLRFQVQQQQAQQRRRLNQFREGAGRPHTFQPRN